MRSIPLAVLLLGCQAGPGEGTVPCEGCTGVDDPDPTGSDTDTPTLPEVCEADPALAITRAESLPGPRGNQVEIQVDLSVDASVAVLCSAQGDPDEQHLVESTVPATSHVLRLSGLRPGAVFECSVAATCPTLAGEPTPLSFETAPADGDVPPLSVEIDPTLGITGAYTLGIYENGACSGGPTWLAIWDEAGRVRWTERLPDGVQMDVEALYDPEDGTIVWGGGESSNGRPHVIDLWDLDVAADLPDWENANYHHDAKRMEDGRILVLRDVDNTDGNEVWDGFGIQVFDPATGQIDFDFDSQPLVDDGTLELPSGFLTRDDPYHANWMEWVETPTGPELYVSLCFSWQVLALDPETREVLWLLDDHSGWTVQDIDGTPLSGDDLPHCQHGLEVDGNRFLFYDNGQDQPHSQAVEWEIDGPSRTATRVWSWTENSWNEETLGDIDDLGNGRILLTQAHPECWSPGTGISTITEVDRATGQVASRMTFPRAADTTYRAERYDGCSMFSSTAYCPALATRRDELLTVF